MTEEKATQHWRGYGIKYTNEHSTEILQEARRVGPRQERELLYEALMLAEKNRHAFNKYREDRKRDEVRLANVLAILNSLGMSDEEQDLALRIHAQKLLTEES